MRTANAYTAKLKAEALGRTFKVQDTNRRLFTTSLYRGAAGCGPIDFTQINYVPPCVCKYLGPAPPAPFIPTPPPVIPSIISGGTPAASGQNILDGGSPGGSGSLIIDGGRVIPTIDGGSPSVPGSLIRDGGRPSSSGPTSINGGKP